MKSYGITRSQKIDTLHDIETSDKGTLQMHRIDAKKLNVSLPNNVRGLLSHNFINCVNCVNV